MTTRRTFITAVGATLLAAPLVSLGQQGIRRIGYLANDPDEKSPTFQAFIGQLRKLGWARGKNVDIRYETSEGRDERFPELATRLVRANVDVIVTTGSPSTRAAKAATDRIPIVFGSAANPVEQGFVSSLARPGGNVTGLALSVQELGPKRWQLLKEMLPHAKRFARLYDANSLASFQPEIIETDDIAAQKLGVSVRHIPVAQKEGLPGIFDVAARSGIQGMHVTAAAVFVVHREYVARLALKYNMPIIGPDSRFVQKGLLSSYGEDFLERYERAASVVDKVLRGGKPADIPVDRSTKLELVVNLTAAKTIGVTVPRNVMVQVDRSCRVAGIETYDRSKLDIDAAAPAPLPEASCRP